MEAASLLALVPVVVAAENVTSGAFLPSAPDVARQYLDPELIGQLAAASLGLAGIHATLLAVFVTLYTVTEKPRFLKAINLAVLTAGYFGFLTLAGLVALALAWEVQIWYAIIAIALGFLLMFRGLYLASAQEWKIRLMMIFQRHNHLADAKNGAVVQAMPDESVGDTGTK